MSRRRDAVRVVAVMVAVFMSGLFFALAAISVDVARWYMEIESVQKAADAGALAGVTHMPQDLNAARATTREVSSRNGYPDGGATAVHAQAATAEPAEGRGVQHDRQHVRRCSGSTGPR